MKKNLPEIGTLQKRMCHDNSEEAFSALFRLCYSSLYHFAMQYVHKHEIAEELVNDVFVNVWKQRAALAGVQNLKSYLFIAVKNGSLNYLRQYSNYHVAIDEDTVKLVSVYKADEETEWKELHFKLQQAINSLPNQCRHVFRLVKEEGFRMKEVAGILGISPRTVEKQLYDAVKRLDNLLNELYRRNKNNLDKSISIVAVVASLAALWH